MTDKTERPAQAADKSADGMCGAGRAARDARAAGAAYDPCPPMRRLATFAPGGTADRMLSLLTEANALLRETLVDDDRREAYMARKRALLADMEAGR